MVSLAPQMGLKRPHSTGFSTAWDCVLETVSWVQETLGWVQKTLSWVQKTLRLCSVYTRVCICILYSSGHEFVSGVVHQYSEPAILFTTHTARPSTMQDRVRKKQRLNCRFSYSFITSKEQHTSIMKQHGLDVQGSRRKLRGHDLDIISIDRRV